MSSNDNSHLSAEVSQLEEELIKDLRGLDVNSPPERSFKDTAFEPKDKDTISQQLQGVVDHSIPVRFYYAEADKDIVMEYYREVRKLCSNEEIDMGKNFQIESDLRKSGMIHQSKYNPIFIVFVSKHYRPGERASLERSVVRYILLDKDEKHDELCRGPHTLDISCADRKHIPYMIAREIISAVSQLKEELIKDFRSFEDTGIRFSENEEEEYRSRFDTEFQYVSTIGHGAYGVVYKATHRIDLTTYAVKRITVPKREDSKEKVPREVQALAKLDHRNIVRYCNSWIENPPEGWQDKYDARIGLSKSTLSSSTASSDDTHPLQQPRSYLFIQMQLYRTETLCDWLKKNIDRDNSVVLEWFKQVTEAIQYVHEKQLVHRDLKPANIFLTDEDIIKVGDFGLAAALDENEQVLNYRGIGTLVYRSPEIKEAKGNLKSEKVDIFSMGIILFEMLHPFTTDMERRKVLEDLHEYKYPEKFSKEMPKVKDLVSCLTAKNPDERPSAMEILDQHLPNLRAETNT